MNDSKSEELRACWRFSWKMFEPEYQDMDCPRCNGHRVYADRQIGFYCMACGYELSAREVLMLIEKRSFSSRPEHKIEPDSSRPIAQIKELPARRTSSKEHADQQRTRTEHQES